MAKVINSDETEDLSIMRHKVGGERSVLVKKQ